MNFALYDNFSQQFIDSVAATLRGGKRAAETLWYIREQKEAMRLLCLEEDDIWCCGDCCAEQQSCIICGRETSASVQKCPRPLMVTIETMSDVLCLDTALGLAWINSALRGRQADQSYPGGTRGPVYVSVI